MTNSKNIAHKGFVRAIKNGKAEISLLDATGCESCQIKGSCGASTAKNKVVQVPIKIGTFSVGEEVDIEMTYQQGFRALFMAYILPFILVIFTLVVGNQKSLSEPVLAISALGVLPIYYTLLYFFKSAITKQFHFKVKKTL